MCLHSAKYGHERVSDFTYKSTSWLVTDDKITQRYEITLELKLIQAIGHKSLGLLFALNHEENAKVVNHDGCILAGCNKIG